MRNKWGSILLLIGLLTACSIRPARGPAGGSDVVVPLWTTYSNTNLPADTLQCANVVALLIGIGHYEPDSGWESLNTQNDVDLMVATLRKRGVRLANIHTLTDRQATKSGIGKALKMVADTMQRGSQLLVLYAGHARQLPDDNGDEADGYDEAIVPYDAPPANQFRSDGYLRDDELNHYLNQIRATLGPAGSLWLLFDSCHSQTLNRGQMAQHARGGIVPMGKPATTHRKQFSNDPIGAESDWYEPTAPTGKLATYVLFAATTDNGPNFETTDASGRSFGPLTRAVCEIWNNRPIRETYRSLFAQVAAVMSRYAPYQQPGLEGDADAPTPGCGSVALAGAAGYRTTGEPVRVAWPRQDAGLTKILADLPFAQLAGTHPDLRIDRRGRGYRLVSAANNQSLSAGALSTTDCVERIRQYFARTVLLQLQQTNPDFRVRATLQRVAVKTEQGRTVVTDTLSTLTTAGLPTFRTLPTERVVLTLTNIGVKPAFLTVVDLQPDGTLHILLPGAGQSAASCWLLPGQSLRQRIRITEPLGAEVYKILLTPESIDLRAVLQTRGNALARHPYEALFQRSYVTRGTPEPALVALSDRTGATAEITFWVTN